MNHYFASKQSQFPTQPGSMGHWLRTYRKLLWKDHASETSLNKIATLRTGMSIKS